MKSQTSSNYGCFWMTGEALSQRLVLIKIHGVHVQDKSNLSKDWESRSKAEGFKSSSCLSIPQWTFWVIWPSVFPSHFQCIPQSAVIHSGFHLSYFLGPLILVTCPLVAKFNSLCYQKLLLTKSLLPSGHPLSLRLPRHSFLLVLHVCLWLLPL